ncbi:MAG TPA: KH domain-containing protein [archaeon]|nr:KH domain-containing protein [archaeon]
MKGPICIEDAKTNRLCLICEAKLKAGMISENDVRIWKELVRMSETNFLLGLEFLRSFEVNHSLNIVCKGTIGPLIGRGGKNIKELEQKLGKKIHIIEKTADAKETAQSVLGNITIVAVNRVFRPEAEELKIIVMKQDSARIQQKEETEKILSKIIGTKTTIEFA